MPNKPRKTKKMKASVKKSTTGYNSMSVDDFLAKDFEKSDSESSTTPEMNESSEEEQKVDNSDVENEEMDENLESDEGIVENEESENEIEEQEQSEEEIDDKEQSGDEFENHKKSLDKLKDTDPEFYKFLQENDKKLLEFDLSDDEEKKQITHKPPTKLEVASDESDYEDEIGNVPVTSKVITLKLLKKWQNDIRNDKTNGTIVALIEAFHGALLTVSPDEEQKRSYKVEGSAAFNGVIQLCVLELGPAVRQFLGVKPRQAPHKCKRFVKIKRVLKEYFTDLHKILTCVTSKNIQLVLLKHLHYMTSLLVSYQTIAKSILKCLIDIWGKTDDEKIGIVAYFCILRITNNNELRNLDFILKRMYLAFMKNSKFINVNNLALINFMRRSLVEMFSLDLNVSYQIVFLYIRQLGIHLRNAITVNKKENIQSVYNWQFINSLKLWGNLLEVTINKDKSNLQTLLYPFVQICIGTIKLVPTVQYYPLRFHVIKILMDLSKNTDCFIPILPFLIEVLNMFDFNKKHEKLSVKSMDLTCLLRLSKSQMNENGFKDAIIDVVYSLLLEYLTEQSCLLAFPDLTLFCVVQLKQFLKSCNVAKYKQKMKQILDKIEETNKFLENERKHLNCKLSDTKQINGWESQIRNKQTPLMKFYENWIKIHNLNKKKQITHNEELGDYQLPTLKKRKLDNTNKGKKTNGPVELFPSDSEDDNDNNNVKLKRKRGKRAGKNVNKKINDESGPMEDFSNEKDIIQDLKIDDW